MDFNGDGVVTKDEIRYMMETKGHFISDHEASNIARKMDFNRDGVVTHNEFVDSVRPRSPNRRVWSPFWQLQIYGAHSINTKRWTDIYA